MTDDVKNFKSEYEEEGFWLGNNIMWTAENTYQTIQQILYDCEATAQCWLESRRSSGGGGCAPPAPSP